MELTRKDLNRFFASRILQRGQHYHRTGRVQQLEVNGINGPITAKVIGTRIEPYEVSVRVAANAKGTRVTAIEGECSCPIGYNCKHVVATLLKAQDELSRQPQPSNQRTRKPAAPRAPTLSRSTLSWFDRLSTAADTDTDGEYPATVRDRLLYLLKPESTERASLAVEIVAARLLKNGSYGKHRHYGFSNALYGNAPKFVTGTDIAILQDLQRHNHSGLHLSGIQGAKLLERMLETSRCHWQRIDTPALTVGEARAARLAWSTDARGLSRLILESDPPAEIFPLSPPWYVDPEQGLCGPATSGLPDSLAAELTTSPALPVEELAGVQRWLEKNMSHLFLPSPPELSVAIRDDIEPTPQLHLYSQQRPYYFSYGNDNTAQLHGAQFSFDYHGTTVKPWDTTQYFDHYSEHKVLRILRNKHHEAKCTRRLVELGMDALTVFHQHYTLPPGTKNDLGLASDEEWITFMIDCVPRLRSEGWRITTAKGFRFDLAEVGDWYADLFDGQGGMDWFGISLGVEVDGKALNLLPVLSAYLERRSPKGDHSWLGELADNDYLMLTLDNGKLLPLPAGRARAILDVLIELQDQPTLDAEGRLKLPRIQAGRLLELQQALEGTPLRWQGGQALRDLAERLRGASVPAQVATPEQLRVELRPYQQQGLAWLQFLRDCELGGLLADDMGLGKTVQALAHILVEKAAGRLDQPCLIIAPTSLMANWRAEAARFAPALRVLTLQGPKRREAFAAIAEHDLILSTYPLLPRDSDALLAHEYHLLILDEAHAIKNPKSQAGVVARHIRAHQRLCLTGTPMENHLGEMWSLFDFLMPGLLGGDKQFRRLFRRPIEQFGDNERRELLTRRVRPFLLRRRKDQVATELPAKTDIIRTVELHGGQRDLYESIRYTMQQKVRRQIQRNGIARSYIVILEALLKLRQVCCDPRLLKLDAAQTLAKSAKFDLLLELLPGLVEEGRRILLFSQFTSMLALIEPALAKLKIDYVKLTGQTRDRAGPVERFQAGEVPLFLISLKAGGVGLNLTAADTVIHYDPWWNPAVEDQATDRAHRIGQDKPVFVYKLYTEGTVEEKIRELQARKRELTAGILDADGNASPRWTDDDLDYLLAPLQ